MKILMLIIIVLWGPLFTALPGSAAESRPAEIKEKISHKGSVKEVLETSGKYIFVQIDEQGRDIWIATMGNFFKEKLVEGDKIEYKGGDTFKDFRSKILNRTFDSIIFVTRIRVLNEDSLKSDQAMPQGDQHKQMPAIKKTVTAPAKGEIKKAEGGWNIEELFQEKDRLNGKEVVLRGRVTKIINNILGMTWVTLQDGTGTASEDKIIAVTKEAVSMGDVLTARGILQTNVNLGSGYKYKALIDEAKFTK